MNIRSSLLRCSFFLSLLLLTACSKEIIGGLSQKDMLDAQLILDRAAVEAGLALLEAGGDFADGAIAFEGRRLGGEIFATFDKKAAALLKATGQSCLLLTVD